MSAKEMTLREVIEKLEEIEKKTRSDIKVQCVGHPGEQGAAVDEGSFFVQDDILFIMT